MFIMSRLQRSKILDSEYIDEFFLSNNITQGEKIPFYILWKGENPNKLELKIEGFKSFIEFYNVECRKDIDENTICATKFYIRGYVGGLLDTEITETPIKKGTLYVKVVRNNGQVRILTKKRNLYTTSLEITEVPTNLNSSNYENKINICLKGNTTVFLYIEELEGNQCHFIIPPPLRERIEQNIESIRSELSQLRVIAPTYLTTINTMEEFFYDISNQDMAKERIKELSDSPFGNEPSFYSLIDMITTNLLYHQSTGTQIFRSFSEYLESYSTKKAYFSNPLMFVETPRGKSLLAIKIVAKNLLCQECSSPIELSIPIFSKVDSYLDLKKLISFRRVDYDIN